MPSDNVKALMQVIELHEEACAAIQAVIDETIEYQQQAWNQFKQVEIWYQNNVREFASERAALVTQKVFLEATINFRDQEKQVSLRMLSAIAEKRLDDRYRVTLNNFMQERKSFMQQIGVLQQQLQQQSRDAKDFQTQVQEYYRTEAQKAVDTIAAQAKAREADIVASIEAGSVAPVVEQQLFQMRVDLREAQQSRENWKGDSLYWEDKAKENEAKLFEAEA